MIPKLRIVGGATAAISAIVLAAAKPAPTPTSFTPAISYRYGYTELRLANADGSQAALLLRLPAPSGQIVSILQHAIAPLGRGQVAFVDASVFGVKSLRIVSWTQPSPGGPLDVTLDSTPMFSIAGNGAEITSLDFSPDGSRLAAVSWVNGLNQEVRFFDVDSRTLIGEPIPLAQDGSVISWRAFDNSLLMRGAAGMSALKNGVQTPLFDPGRGGWFDSFNGSDSSVLLQILADNTNTLRRWDGTSQPPSMAFITAGHQPNISCDNARVIFQSNLRRSKTIIRTLATGIEQTFSQDGSITYPRYPNGCG